MIHNHDEVDNKRLVQKIRNFGKRFVPKVENTSENTNENGNNYYFSYKNPFNDIPTSPSIEEGGWIN